MISASTTTTASPIASATPRAVDREATPRQMRLTPELVARVARHVDDPGPIAGRAYATDADYEAATRALLGARPVSGELWVFAYGSLIWKPACDIIEQRVAVARGWHRAFCLGWDRRFRGSTEWPGLMLALDRGGTCKGVVQRLPPDAAETSLGMLLRREMLTKPSPFPPRWVTVRTAAGPLRAITFAMDRRSDAYVGGLSAEQIADVLAVAVGHWGSMAEYLHNTVRHLEELGIGDRFLWRLQEMVAGRIEAATMAPPVAVSRKLGQRFRETPHESSPQRRAQTQAWPRRLSGPAARSS